MQKNIKALIESAEVTKERELYLINYQIKEVPQEIGKLKDLDYLFLSHNQLNELPNEIGD